MFHIKAVVVSESKRTGEPKHMGLEMRKGAIANLKSLRVEAEESNLSMADMKEVDTHRKGLKKKA